MQTNPEGSESSKSNVIEIIPSSYRLGHGEMDVEIDGTVKKVPVIVLQFNENEAHSPAYLVPFGMMAQLCGDMVKTAQQADKERHKGLIVPR